MTSARVTKSIEEFRENRHAAPLATRSVLYWHPEPGLRFIAAFGAVTPEDMDVLIAVMHDEARPGFLPYSSLVDMSDVEAVDSQGFDRFVQFMRENVSAFARVTVRSAYVHGEGNRLASAAVAGYARMIGSPVPTGAHPTVERGLDALGFEHRAAELGTQLAALKARARDTYRILGPVEDAIRADIVHPAAEKIANAVGRSRRTLQRELSTLGTTLTDEVRRVRVGMARRLLVETDLAVTDVAKNVGFGTTKGLRTAFSREAGMLPSAFRARERRLASSS